MTRIAPKPMPPEGLQKPAKSASKARKRIAPVSVKKSAYRRSAIGRDAAEHMRRVKQLPCVICGKPGPSDAHHVIHGRFSARKATDFQVIPLCEACHRYPHRHAIHTGKKAWAERNGPDWEYLPVVADMLAGEFNF